MIYTNGEVLNERDLSGALFLMIGCFFPDGISCATDKATVDKYLSYISYDGPPGPMRREPEEDSTPS